MYQPANSLWRISFLCESATFRWRDDLAWQPDPIRGRISLSPQPWWVNQARQPGTFRWSVSLSLFADVSGCHDSLPQKQATFVWCFRLQHEPVIFCRRISLPLQRVTFHLHISLPFFTDVSACHDSLTFLSEASRLAKQPAIFRWRISLSRFASTSACYGSLPRQPATAACCYKFQPATSACNFLLMLQHAKAACLFYWRASL